jgi:hypothetical protein
MRMWMVSPHLLCKKHLLGEHYELHMLVGHLRKGHSINGYLLKRLVDPSSIFERHQTLEREIRLRGGNPSSPLSESECTSFAKWFGVVAIDPGESMSVLSERCDECRNRIGAFVRVKLTQQSSNFIPW